MKFHGIQITEGSNVGNLTVASGTAFPSNANEGELFYRSDAATTVKGLYLYVGGNWDRIASADSITAPSGVTFPGSANIGDMFYKDSDDAGEGLYVYNGATWIPAASGSGSTTTATGDVTGVLTIGGSGALTLANTGVTAGSFGGVTETLTLTVDSKGRVTTVNDVQIALPAAQVTSGTFDDARVAQSNVTQHQAALALDGSQLTSGSIPDARVAQSNVTQHQAALSILESQIVDGTIFPRINGSETITGSYQFNNPVVVPTPSSGSHATSKDYVDQAIAGLAWKNSVRVATTANITLSGTQTIDGVLLSAGNRVLVKDQSTSSQNGVYVVAAGAWSRSTDFDSISPIDEINSAAVFVQQGTVNADTAWTQVSPVSLVGTDAITFTQFAGANTYLAGAGMTLSTNTFNIGTASASRIVVNTDNIDLATVGTPVTDSLLRFTTDAYGRVTGTSAVQAADLTGVLDSTYVNVGGDTMTGALTITAANSGLVLNSTAGTSRRVTFQTSGSARWVLNADTTAESGSNAGSNFAIYRHDDAGAFIDAPLVISRSSGLITTTGSFYISRSAPVITLNATTSGQPGQIDFRTGNLQRWTFQKNNTAETGSNAGSNITLTRYDDAGTIIDTPLIIYRNTGTAAFNGQVSAASFLGSLIGNVAFTGVPTTMDANVERSTGLQVMSNTTGSTNFPANAGVTLEIRRAPVASNGSSMGTFQLFSQNSSTTDFMIRKVVSNPAGTETWSSWNKIWTAADFSATTYVQKAGDTMTGALTISSGAAMPLTIESSTEFYMNLNSTNVKGGFQRFQTSGTTYLDIGTTLNTLGAAGNNNTPGINARDSRSLVLSTNQIERMRIAAAGQVLIGTTTSRGNTFGGASGLDSALQIEGTTFVTSSATYTRNSADTNPSYLVLAKTRSASVGGNTAVAAADALGIVSFQGADGTNVVNSAEIRGSADLTPSTGIVPGRLGFWTASAAGTVTERMRIDSSGNIAVNTTPFSWSRLTLNGGLYVSGPIGSVAAVSAGVFSFETPVLREYIGDGTGYSRTFSKRTASTTTDLITILDSSGNFGIGATSPLSRLDVRNADAFSTVVSDTSLQNNTSTVARFSFTTDPVAAITGGTGVAIALSPTPNRGESFLVSTHPTASKDASEFAIWTSNGGVAAERLKVGVSSISIGNTANFSISEGTESLMNIFRQASSGATVLANGMKYTGTANGFASSYSPTWARSAIVLGTSNGAGSIGFYSDPTSVVAAGTDVSPTLRMLITNSGNVGIGTVPGAWTNTARAIEFSYPTFGMDGPGQAFMAFNLRETSSGNWVYKSTDTGQLFRSGAGGWIWSTAASGTIGGAATVTERMRLDANGALGIGTSPVYRLHVQRGSSGISAVFQGTTTTNQLYIGHDDTNNVNYIGSSGAVGRPLAFYTGNVEIARLDASGNLCVGRTSSSGLGIIQTDGNVDFAKTTGNQIVNIRASSTFQAEVSIASNGNSQGTSDFLLRQSSTNEAYIWNRSSGVMYFGTANTERMRLSAGGADLGLGGTPNSNGAGWGTFTVNGSSGGAVEFNAAGTRYGQILGNSGEVRVSAIGALPINFQTNGVNQRMTITSTGQIGMGGNTNGIAGGLSHALAINYPGGGTMYGIALKQATNTTVAMNFVSNSDAVIGSISTTATTTAFNTSSDVRLKKNIAPAASFGSVIDAIEVVSFDWKVDDSHQRAGFIAQDLHTVAPEAVRVGDSDPDTVTDTWAVDPSKLIPMLIKEIQELRARVSALENT